MTVPWSAAANGVVGVSYIDVNVIDSGTISVPDNNPRVSDTNLRFDGANNSFSGSYIGRGMIDYGNPERRRFGHRFPRHNRYAERGLYHQLGHRRIRVASLRSPPPARSRLLPAPGTLHRIRDNGTDTDGKWNISRESEPGTSANFYDNGGTIEKTGGTGTTDVDTLFQYGIGNRGYNLGSIIINTGTLAFDGPQSQFDNTISGNGTLSLGSSNLGGGTSTDTIYGGATITTAGWTITDSGTEVTLEESLSYSGFLTVQSGATLTLANDSTLTVAHLTGSDATVVIDAGSSHINETTGSTYGPGTYSITELSSPCYCPGTLIETDRGEVPVEALAIGNLVLTSRAR